MMVDLRGVNSLIIPKLVQLPQIEELEDNNVLQTPVFLVHGHIVRVLSNSISEESRDLTSFTGPDGRRWRYTRAPMGMANSLSALNLLISNIFSDKSRFHNLACYVDDILIYSNDWNDHIRQLERALKTCKKTAFCAALQKLKSALQR